MLEKCKRYLEGQHVVLWGEVFDIQDEKQREAAAQWLASVFAEVMEMDDVGLE
jgi:hypothetical protein